MMHPFGSKTFRLIRAHGPTAGSSCAALPVREDIASRQITKIARILFPRVRVRPGILLF